MKLPPVKIRRIRSPKVDNTPRRPAWDNGDEAELLEGQVNGMKASAPEERMAKALSGKKIPFEFRYTLGAPRGLPGFKELDFLIQANGQYYAVECDTEFTHRNKGASDVLHDAIVLKDLRGEGFQVFPEVLHIMGETDLADQLSANNTVKRLFGDNGFQAEVKAPVLTNATSPAKWGYGRKVSK